VQFFKNTTNKRNDEYGGSVDNRCRFPLEARHPPSFDIVSCSCSLSTCDGD
jgi:hypothetical protein